ncbi:MAG: GntR family transcriptional regulator [Tissierellia bacterium]|nr:GntR family transcriptional regulator [Tissierellia bacterium]
MKILISNSNKQPIYEQISFQIKEQIINGVLAKNELLPSIRNLAKELEVSVITTKRAYEELERDGFIHTVQGKGTFVASQSLTSLEEKKFEIIEEDLIKIVKKSKMLNIPKEQLIKKIKIIYEQEE